jgi:two-component system sensor histidine kinase RegB
MVQLIYLRWIAVGGQIATIVFVETALHTPLPLGPMSLVLGGLVALNVVSLLRLRRSDGVTNEDLFFALVFDALALTAQLYFSGGATNPFTSLYLLQVILGAVLLEVWSTWALVAITVACFCGLTVRYRPIAMPMRPGVSFFDLHIEGMLVGFLLNAALLVVFVTRINANLRVQDARLADLRQQAAEEDHIVRMGLLASGAAHELGTPLATLDVILGDWRRMPELAGHAELIQDIEDMQSEVRRCKTIVTGVLLSAGEARGEAPAVTTLKAFIENVVADWRSSRSATAMAFDDRIATDMPIVSDSALKQVIHNVLDNALDASPAGVKMSADTVDDELVLSISDTGAGFAPATLADFGKPYNSTKARPGGGLGLFLVVNVVRKFGGRVEARNRSGGGALVTLVLPLSALQTARGHGA